LEHILLNNNIELNNYVNNAVETSQKTYEKVQPFVDESRVSHPAWMYRDLEQTRWEVPFINPLVNVEKKFHDNIQTRILEKDFYIPIIPQPMNYAPLNQYR
jgi:hypothetical protein